MKLFDLTRWLARASLFWYGGEWRPLVRIHGNVRIAHTASICEPAELNGTGSEVRIGEHCDIASYVVINVADSLNAACYARGGLWVPVRAPIVLDELVRVGSHSYIGPGVRIGRRSVIGAGTILTAVACSQAQLEKDEEGLWVIPPLSLVVGNPAEIKPGYYRHNA